MLIPTMFAAYLFLQPQPERPFYPPAVPPRREQPRPQNQDGPWNHQIHFATSTDGLAFTEDSKPIMTQASVPDIIQLARDLPQKETAACPKGTLLIYTVDARPMGPAGPGHGARETISRLVSVDGGKSWSSPQPVSFDWTKRPETGGTPVDPSIIQLEDGRLRMYYYWMEPPPRPQEPRDPEELPSKLPGRDPRPQAPDPADPRRPADPARPDDPPRGNPPELNQRHIICSAISEDGLRFKSEDGARLADNGITDPEVIKTGDQYLMFLSRGEETLLARSTDGLRFDRDRDFVLRAGGVPGAVVLADGRVRVYQTSREGIISVLFDPKSGMFKAEEGVRIQGPCGDPAVCPSENGGDVMVLKRFMK